MGRAGLSADVHHRAGRLEGGTGAIHRSHARRGAAPWRGWKTSSSDDAGRAGQPAFGRGFLVAAGDRAAGHRQAAGHRRSERRARRRLADRRRQVGRLPGRHRARRHLERRAGRARSARRWPRRSSPRARMCSLAPTVNIHRSVTNGRNFECYSEDPVLTGQLAVAFITGLQGQGIARDDQAFRRQRIRDRAHHHQLRDRRAHAARSLPRAVRACGEGRRHLGRHELVQPAQRHLHLARTTGC